jgi:transcriptional regulator with XRE-family HTH domain
VDASVIGTNIKKLRDERAVTQLQLADAVNVSFQAVSKWENGAAAPDISLLPAIAEFFDVKIDDLFKPDMTAYRHKPQRLMAVYENNIRDNEAFGKADSEYQKLFRAENIETCDFTDYAYLHDLRARYHDEVAEQYYCHALACGEAVRDNDYFRCQGQYPCISCPHGQAAGGRGAL